MIPILLDAPKCSQLLSNGPNVSIGVKSLQIVPNEPNEYRFTISVLITVPFQLSITV